MKATDKPCFLSPEAAKWKFVGFCFVGIACAVALMLAVPGKVPAGAGQSILKLGEWVESAPFPPGSVEHECAGWGSAGTWKVGVVDGDLRILAASPWQIREDPLPFDLAGRPEPLGEWAAERTVLKVDDGFLVGLNWGDWGAGIWWFSESGDVHYRVMLGNPKGLISDGQRVLAITGYTQFGVGAVAHLERNKLGKWAVAEKLDLGSAAAAVARESNGGVLIVTEKGLMRYQEGSLESLHRSYLAGLYVNSLVVMPGGGIFAGMRHAVIRFSPKGDGTYRETWLVPRRCSKVIPPERGYGKCSCVAGDD